MHNFCPHIYGLARSALASNTSRAVALSQATALGFDHVLVDTDDAPESALRESLVAASQAGFVPVLRLSLDSLSPEHALATERPQWFRSGPGEGLPDPRHARKGPARMALDVSNSRVLDDLAAWWTERLVRFASDGARVFCLMLDGPASPAFFRTAIESVKAANADCQFWAWTPGVSAERVVSLQSCGFDAAFSSSAWWDFRSPWLEDEHRRLQPYGAVLALLHLPGQAALSARQVWLGACTANGAMAFSDAVDAACDASGAGDTRETRESAAGLAALKSAFALQRSVAAGRGARSWHIVSAPHAPVAALLLVEAPREASDMLDAVAPVFLLANATADSAMLDAHAIAARCDGLALSSGLWPDAQVPAQPEPLTLQAHEVRLYRATPMRAAASIPRDARRAAEASARAPRVAVESITPCVDDGRFPAKRSAGEWLSVQADLFGEGHDRIAAVLRWRAADETEWHESRLEPLGNDRWSGGFLLARVGKYQFQVQAWIDVFGAYRDELEKKTVAGQQVSLELREGRLLLEKALGRAQVEERQQLTVGLKRAIKRLDEQRQPADQVTHLLSPEVLELMTLADERPFSVTSAQVLQVQAERRAAGFSSWYELFPRSMGPDASRHGTFADVVDRLPAIRDMGFDTLYFPPIHPIGLKHRKGRNNSLEAGADDPGSPYAIGSADGGHDAIHPELGTLVDFQALRQAAHAHGLELALDFAIQCSPDHPWLREHPDWFSWRPDGTIRYAENPPKKYQDIVNVDFYASGAVPALWIALRDVVIFWIRQGVKVFRVDNPHTKPMPFWEWLIADVRSRFPEAIFLAEAFTRPKPMYRLAKLGFSQSYTYFTWRHTKQEFIDYLTELSQGPPSEFFRPHFFVNTPDINPYFLQRSGRAGFVIRAALATLLSGLWGMYSGFELCEAAPVAGKEEYLNSEKYELRQRDWTQPGNIIAEITLLNQLRRSNPALQTHLGVQFCQASGEAILCFTKTAALPQGGGSNIILAAICMDPHAAHACEIELPLESWGLDESASVACEDLVNGGHFTLQGRRHRLELDPEQMAFSVWRLRPEGAV